MRYALVIIIAAIVLGAFFYFILPVFWPAEDVLQAQFARIWPAGWLEYKSWIFKFSLLYPDDLRVREYSEGRGTTIAFQSEKTGRGFQIFVVPYPEDHITPERFKSDVPSGVIQDQQEILIDGARATMFYSQNAVMGDTREVWFIKNGFLYEATTYRDLDAWLSNIMQTWRFLEF